MPPVTKPRRPPPPPPQRESPPPPLLSEEEIIPDLEKRHRTPKLQKLESAVGGLYIMLGGAMSTLPDQMAGPRIKVIGVSVARSSDEIAEAWIDLAEDDRRVLKALESLTSFSGWGKVIGVHLMAVGSAVPGIAPMMQTGQQSQPQPQGNGMTDAQAAMIMAEMLRQSQSQAREEQQQQAPADFGRPPQQQAPQRQQQQQPIQTRPGRNVGMPSASDLGVSVEDAAEAFPSSGPENVRG